jgi:biopolymer transport protein ExbB
MEISETTIVDGTLVVLGCFSLLNWSVILLKAGEVIFHRYKNWSLIKQFHKTGTHVQDQATTNTQAGRVLKAGQASLEKARGYLAVDRHHYESWHELIERSLRQQVQKEKAKMEQGLGWLASIGSTAPFVGLFGTVWGIMHALKDISAKGSASLEVVAGPIGEALIATALGIAVAIPAVIAYNFFLRQNRRIVAALDHLAADFLHSSIETHLIQATANEHGHTLAN